MSAQSYDACTSYGAVVLLNHVSSCSYPLIKWTILFYDETCMRVTGSITLMFSVFLRAFQTLEVSIGMVCDHLPKLGCELNDRLIEQA